MRTLHKVGLLTVSLLLPVFLSSCTTTARTSSYPVVQDYSVQLAPSLVRHDLYHTVQPGETLWRIAKMYGVEMQEVMRANDIRIAEQIAVGQNLRIPRGFSSGATGSAVYPTVPLFPSTKWRYIIVHHSATDQGSASQFNVAHAKRGFGGIGYDFVIDNGTAGKRDGQIEASPRWLKQQDGAHCRASGMNHRGIGICLVGNFSRERPSAAQMDALVGLVNMLKGYYRIPVKNVMGHGQVYGARTECPGAYFSMTDFRRRLEPDGVR